MGKRKPATTVDELLARPFCFYCERDFSDLRILISHQKAKHFKCSHCNRRLNTAGGLGVHLQQVHKEQLTAVDNALPNRADAGTEIFGMEGIPDDVKVSHRDRVVKEFYAKAESHRQLTGNPPPGSGQLPNKKPKLASGFDPLKRLRELDDPNAGKKAEAQAPAEAMDVDSSTYGQVQGHVVPGYAAPGFHAPPPVGQHSDLPQRVAPPPGAVNGHAQPPQAVPTVTNADVDRAVADRTGHEAAPAGETKEAAKPGKKDKIVRLTYDDNKVSPEERRAKKSRFAFERPADEETVLGPADGAALQAGVALGPDDVMDKQGD